MDIPSISCALPVCNQSNEEQTTSSLIIRVVLAALGAVAIVSGILTLYGVPGIQNIGSTGGWILIGSGSAAVLLSFCLKCVSDELIEPLQEAAIYDERAAEKIYETVKYKTPNGGIIEENKLAYCSLSALMHSKDFAAKHRQIAEMVGTKDYRARLRENFGTDSVELAIPLEYHEGKIDNAPFVQFAKLIFLSSSDLLSLPLDEISAYNQEQRNLLCLRLQYITLPTQDSVRGSPPCLLDLLHAQPQTETDPRLHLFFTQAQVTTFLESGMLFNTHSISELLPYSLNLKFITSRSERILLELPPACLNRILPFLNGHFLPFLLEQRPDDLDYEALTEKEMMNLFPASIIESAHTSLVLGSLPIKTINCLLPKMSALLIKLVPGNHLQDKTIALDKVDPDLINVLFESYADTDRTAQKLAWLDIDVLNSILIKLEHRTLAKMPANQLGKEQLNLRVLTDIQFRRMFDKVEKEKTLKKIEALHPTNQAYVKTKLGW